MYSSQTPIDIHCSKLVDWLVQRRHCKKDWGENLALIRRKIRAALCDMPENEAIKQIIIGSKLDYFKSQKIVEILKETEASSKNIFGYYSSQRMKDWQYIVYSYERDYVYLAELATDLIRETTYEVPGIRKVHNNLKREKEEAEKQKANLLRKAQQFNSEYQKLANSYGISGVNVEQELLQQVKTLSSVMDEIVDFSVELKEGLDYYREYASSTSKQDSCTIGRMLDYIINKKNTTVYEWRSGTVPISIEVVESATSTAGNSNSSEIEIFDDEIDFGEDIPSSDSSSGFVHVNKSSEAGNGAIEDAFIKVGDEPVEAQETVCDSDDKIARGDDAKPVLAYRKSRNLFLNNLYELEAFFNQLSTNMDQAGNDDRSSSFLTSEVSRVPKFTTDEIAQISSKIREIISIMSKEKNRILFQMTDSPSFLDQIKERFFKKSKQVSDCTAKANQLDNHIQELDDQIRETELHLKKSIVSAKELQEKVENSLKDLYSGRLINIMGCVS